jgi:hypothetical protein
MACKRSKDTRYHDYMILLDSLTQCYDTMEVGCMDARSMMNAVLLMRCDEIEENKE